MTSVQLARLSPLAGARHGPFELRTRTASRSAARGSATHGPAAPAIVLAHGLMGWHRKPRFANLAEQLSEWFAVYAFDHRGHGASGGVSDFGGAEIADVEEVVRLGAARRATHGS